MKTATRDIEKFHPIEGHSFTLAPCPLCGSPAELWERTHAIGGALKTVMCTHGEEIAGLPNGCPMYLPTEDFYQSRKVDAVFVWNDFAAKVRTMQQPAAHAPIPGATLEWFTALRADVHDRSKEPRNRLQSIDIKIANLSGAPCPELTEEEARQDIIDLTPEAILEKSARDLTQLAAAIGLNLTIERRSLAPLAMGRTEYVIAVWKARP